MKTGKHKLPDQSVLEKLRKIARLAEQGYKGEADNARHKLEKELAEYGLTMEDVLQERKSCREFRYSNKQEFRLFLSVFVHRFGTESEEFKEATYDKSSKKIYVELSDIDFADFAPEWDYYRTEFARELRKTEEALLVAFVNKFDLFNKTPKDDAGNKKISKVDLERLRRALGLIYSIESNPYRKLLGE